jgi:hypothetical protein
MTVSMSSNRQMPGHFKQEPGVHPVSINSYFSVCPIDLHIVQEPGIICLSKTTVRLGHFSDDHPMTSIWFASRLPTRLEDPASASSEGWSRLSVVTSSREYQDFEMRPVQYACRKLDQVRSPKVG